MGSVEFDNVAKKTVETSTFSETKETKKIKNLGYQ